MAQLVVSAAGAAIGSLFGAPQLGWLAGSMLGASLLAPDQKGPRLEDLRVAGTEYGQCIPYVMGSPRLSGQIVWASAKRETAHTQSAKGGPEATNYTYDCDLLILLTENQIAGVSRVWSNGELVWNGTATKSGVWGGITVYLGTDDQLPDPTYEAAVGVGNAPAYRGRGYVVITGLQLGGSGQIPNLTFEIGTSDVLNYSDVMYCIRPNGTTPSFADASVYSWGVSYAGSAVNVDDGTVQLGGESSGYVSLAGGGGDFENHYGDFTIEFDFYADWDAFWYSAYARRYVFSIGGVYFTISPYYTLSGVTWSGSLTYSDGITSESFGHAISPLPLSSSSDTWGQWHEVTAIRKGPVFQLWFGNTLVANNDYTGTAYYDAGTGLFTTPWGISGSHVLGNTTQGGLFKIRNFRVARVDLYPNQATGPFVKQLPLQNYIVQVGAGQQITELMVDSAAALLARCGYETGDVDCSALTSVTKPVRGLAIGQVGSTRTTLEMLAKAYFFECHEADKLYLAPRSADSVVTVPFSEIGASDQLSDGDPFVLTIGNELELPAQVAVSYANTTNDYQTSTEYSDRLISGQESTSAVQLALGMTPAEAKGVADALLIDSLTSLTRSTVSVPAKYRFVNPGNIVTLSNNDGRTYRCRVTTKRDQGMFVEWEVLLDDVAALDSSQITDTGYVASTDPTVIADAQWLPLDIPILRDADDQPGYYVAAAANRVTATDEWPGGQVLRSWDDLEYPALYDVTASCVMGDCLTTLPAWTGGQVFDEASTLSVQVTGELASSTRSAMLLDDTVNAMLIGSEVVRFRLATLVSTDAAGKNTYTLSGFLRGQRGTEWAMGGHVAAEKCVLLNANLHRVNTQTSHINLLAYIKAVTYGKTVSSVTAQEFTDTGIALKPFSPANPRALANGSDIDVTWQRRTRKSYRYGGIGPVVPLGEASESYRVRIYAGATLVRTETVTTPAYTYAAADIAADGFVSTDAITFEICQMSATVGAGYPATVTGTAP